MAATTEDGARAVETMPLAGHLRELRGRLVKAALAIMCGVVVGFLLRDRMIAFLARPVCSMSGVQGIGRATGNCHNGVLTLAGPTAGISLAFDIAIFSGLVLAAPVWLYQLWAFLAPALYAREKRYSLGFIGAALPLFACGAGVCYVFLPAIMRVMVSFVPSGVSVNLPLDHTLVFFLRMMTVFGVSFTVPLILVLLNVLGILSAARMRRSWRATVMAIFVFCAIAVPTGDPIGMSVLAAPICLLFFAALAVSTVHDRRRARRRARDPIAGLTPDQATPIDLITPQADPARDADQGP